MTDIRDARFYVVDEDRPDASKVDPLAFDAAFDKAHALTENGKRVKVLYTEEATQIEITRFISHGIQAELASGA
jgi:hypothetical protein